jgi:hypothetical protein
MDMPHKKKPLNFQRRGAKNTMRIEKAVDGLNGSTNINEQSNYNQSSEKTQLNFNFGNPSKVFKTITCHDCEESRELSGYRFALVAICDCCRTKEDLRILNKRIERRKK